MAGEETMAQGPVAGDVVVYQEKGGRVQLEVRLEGETVWLSLTEMAQLFARDRSVISRQQYSAQAAVRLSARSNSTTSTRSSPSATGSTQSEGPSSESKDHPFSDGNKQIGTLLFLEYLRRNDMLACKDGSLRLADSTMVALALLIAESEPKQKDLMIRLVLNLLEDRR